MSTALSVSSPAIDEQAQTAGELVFRNLLAQILPSIRKPSDRLNCALTCQFGFAMAIPELFQCTPCRRLELMWASGCDLVGQNVLDQHSEEPD